VTDPAAAAEPEPDPEAVAAFLRAHPSFLADRPELYRQLVPPERVHGEALADHMAAMVRAERAHAAAMAERADGVLAAGRAAAGMAARVQEAVLALIGADDIAECIAVDFPALLAVDHAALCAEPPFAGGGRALPPGAVAGLLGGRTVVHRNGSPDDARLLHGEAAPLARYDALVRVPGDPPALLALAAREAWVLDPSQGAGALAFLGRAVAMALER
jgi:hypothetical protein